MRRLVEQGDVRPMQNQEDAMADLRRILAERNELWAKAHVSMDTNNKSIEDCVAELMRAIPAGMQNNMNNVQEA